jgi:hypothetical protein
MERTRTAAAMRIVVVAHDGAAAMNSSIDHERPISNENGKVAEARGSGQEA